jgi:outer membrane usher protein FimD/PapC
MKRSPVTLACWLGLFGAACPGFAFAADQVLAPMGPNVNVIVSGPAMPDASTSPGAQTEAAVRFGLVCLSHSTTCTAELAVMEDPDGWWVEKSALTSLSSSASLQSKTINGVELWLIPKAQSSWDEATSTLAWNLQPAVRPTQELHSRATNPASARSGSIPSLAIYYGAGLDSSGGATFGAQTILSRGNTALFVGGTWADGVFIRDLWRVEHDDVNRQLRYVAGEQIIRGSDPLSGASRITGIGIERAYDTNPLQVVSPRPGLHGVIDQPGVIEVYNNGRLISSDPIQPGPYQLGNTPLGSGSQQIELVFRGLDGSRQVLSSAAFYGSRRALAQGLTDFALRAGQTPSAPGATSGLAWQGWARRGVTPTITLGGRSEGLGAQHNAGLDATASIGIGAIDMAWSKDQAGYQAWSGNITVERNGFDAQVGHTHLDRDYWFLGRESRILGGPASSRALDQSNASIGYGNDTMSLRVTAARRVSEDAALTRTLGLLGSFHTRRNWNWFASMDRMRIVGGASDPRSEYLASVGVVVPLDRWGAGQTLSSRAIQTQQGPGGSVTWNRYRPNTFGWSANASVFQQPGGGHGINGGYDRTTPVGQFLLNGSVSDTSKYGTATWSGTIIRAADQWFASAQDQGPRVLVLNPTTPKAQVLRDNQPVGIVGPRGRIVSGLSPYSQTNISLDANTLPLESDTTGLQKSLILPRFGVAKVTFDTTADGQMEGMLLIDGQPAHLGILTLSDGREGWVGEAGRFWITGGGSGTLSATWSDGGTPRKCAIEVAGSPPQVKSASCK